MVLVYRSDRFARKSENITYNAFMTWSNVV